MRLTTLLEGLFPHPLPFDLEISRLTLDSRCVKSGDTFIALKGTQLNGRDYIQQAITNGANLILQTGDSFHFTQTEYPVPVITLPALTTKLGELSATFYNYPANQLKVIGVTGTNGKTTCTHFIAQILSRLNIQTGVIGTLGSGYLGALSEPGLTTPDAIALQSLFADFVRTGAKAVAMEVSSHSIAQERINGTPFAIGAFTNLTQDHLDYHGNMATYAAVKRQFLLSPAVQQVVINGDDQYGRAWLKQLNPDHAVTVYQTKSYDSGFPTVLAEDITLSLSGIEAKVSSPWGCGLLNLPLVGAFNLSNALAVLTTLSLYGLPFEAILSALQHIQSVPGRMQILSEKDEPLVIVDYAHTPDALEKTLATLAAHIQGQLVCVFGCGGDRDQKKRPKMAQVVEQFADHIIITNDNPRHENPAQIAEDILQGFNRRDQVVIELDRSKAIQKSIQWAKAQDCILIAGKGAEQYQQLGDTKIPFDDATQARKFLKEMRAEK